MLIAVMVFVTGSADGGEDADGQDIALCYYGVRPAAEVQRPG